ncbi:MAG: glycoside hydrolase family 97 protein [Bacteroidaceae bacterium]|nr:glycoside hydrolase family 97 protein [Bacteroidaceae bacterium]
MKKIILGVLALASVWSSAWATEKSFTSPDGKLTVVVEDQNGIATYRVNLGATEFIGSSPLGLNTNMGNYTTDLTLAGCEVKTVKESYDLRNIKQSHVDYEATEAVCSFEQKGKKVMDVIFRVSNRDVAYRYRILPQRDTKVCIVNEEASGFKLPEGTITFMCPQSRPMGGFARTSPSYETSYTDDDQMGKNGWGEGYSFPCLFHLGDKGWVLISETGVDGSYVASRLLNVNGGLYKIGFPQPGECNGWGSTSASVALPCETPWRTITLGTTLAPIVETTVPFDLVAPKYKASQEYIYGKGSWSWIIGMDASCNYDEQKRYIDFSAAMGYQTVLIDALWDKQIGYDKIAELAAYGKTKGVGLFLWYNSNGTWNDAPQSPLGKMDKSRERRAEMAWMKSVGIRGIKVDFFGGDKQNMMQLYEDILSDANDFGILVIFHGCTLPRGWERMYPNYAASEAVLASENLHFGQGACDAEAHNAALHTFIRNTVGSMDFGGSTLNKFYNADNKRGTHRVTSDVYALSTAVLFQSAVQHFALAPNNLTDAPAWAIDFMKDVPTTWDEVKFMDGYPGKYAIIARRAGDHWFIAGINADKEPLKATIDLSMYGKGAELLVYSDDAQLNGGVTTVKAKKQMVVTIPTNGGLVIVNK